MAYPDNLLSRGERVVLHKHPHWKVLILPTLCFVLFIGGGFALAAILRDWQYHAIAWIVIAVVGVLGLIFFTLVPVIRWRTEHFVITNHHVFFRTGILHRREHQIPLGHIQNMETSVSFWGRLLGFGSLIVESAADQPLEFENVAALPKVQSELNQLIMDDRGRAQPGEVAVIRADLRVSGARPASPTVGLMQPRQTDLPDTELAALRAQVLGGGPERYHRSNEAKGKLFARRRIELLVDDGSFIEDGQLANALADGLPADGVVTGTARIDGRTVCLMANDSTVKAGSWGARTVEKIIRVIEKAYTAGVPMVYLVDSAGARITDQVDLFPGRRGAGKIFHTQVRASGSIPQVCALFGPSAAGGAYIPAFCDLVVMVAGNASMYLGSDRMVEMVTGEKTTLEEMGGAKMHTTVSGVGHLLVDDEAGALSAVRRYLSFLPQSYRDQPPPAAPRGPGPGDLRALVPPSERQAFDMRRYARALLDDESIFEIHPGWARELFVGLGRLDGEVVGVVGNNSMFKGGVLFVDSADKATHFVQLCDAFNIPLIFLADVPGFMVGTAVERQGIIRHGAKMIFAVSEATVPKFCVVVRKAYGAGLYAMAGPGFEPDATIALPTAKIAVMGAEAAVNAVYANKIAALAEPDRPAYVAALRADYERDIDTVRLAAELVVDAMVEPEELRAELIGRLAIARGRDRSFSRRRHGVTPV